jgi:hypothetical protein
MTNDAAERLLDELEVPILKALAAERRATTRNARIVAEYWRDEMMQAGDTLRVCAHPLACVIGALDGETDPVGMGIPPDEFARRAAILDAEAER